METIERPKAAETDEDLLRMQECFQKQRLKDGKAVPISVSVKKMSKRTNPMPDPSEIKTERIGEKTEKKETRAGRFTIDLEALQEECVQVVFDVQEKNVEYLEGRNTNPITSGRPSHDFSKEEGFPEVLDLSRYFVPDASGNVLPRPKNGRSIFAVEFERLNGHIDAAVDDQSDESSKGLLENELDAISMENTQRIEGMSADDVMVAKREVIERFDPKLIEFLKTRSHRKKTGNKSTNDTPKESRFKQMRDMSKKGGSNEIGKEVQKEPDVIVEDKVKQLEVFSIDGGSAGTSSDLNVNYTRLAAEAVQLDFAAKCLRTIIPRQQQNVVRLFDSLITPKDSEVKDELLEMARSQIPAIKGLYLDEMNNEKGASTYRFAEGMNPLTDGAWSLLPIRNVLDVCSKDHEVTVQDVVVVRLCVLWTLLMFSERASLFYVCNKPDDVYVRISEIFLIGHEVFEDSVVKSCVSRILKAYVVPQAIDGNLTLIATESVAKLDAFMPFYEDLLSHFEQYGIGDECFSMVLLIGAYMNSSLLDALTLSCALWRPDRNTARQMTLSKAAAETVLQQLTSTRQYWKDELESTYYVQYSQLLAMYAAAIRSTDITRDRNPAMWNIATTELGTFVARHSQGSTHRNISNDKMKEFDILVDIIRKTVAGKLEL